MKKYLVYSLFGLLMLAGCSQNQTGPEPYASIQGKTMGTTYRIQYEANSRQLKANSIDSILALINLAASTYLPESLISQFNQSERGISLSRAQIPNSIDNFFEEIFFISRDVAQSCDGYYDPTVMPLVNYWGFGYEEKVAVEHVDSSEVQRILEYVGMDKVRWSSEDGNFSLSKSHPDVQLDFSSVAKGYAIDIIGGYLRELGIRHYFIDIGGEIACQGASPRGTHWVTGINIPDASKKANEIYQLINLTDMAIATSGNYRNFYKIGERSYGHTMNPLTGYPESSNLLSATVISSDCAVADAYATACMAMGKDRALQLIETTDGVEALLIYAQDETLQSIYTSGFSSFLSTEK